MYIIFLLLYILFNLRKFFITLSRINFVLFFGPADIILYYLLYLRSSRYFSQIPNVLTLGDAQLWKDTQVCTHVATRKYIQRDVASRRAARTVARSFVSQHHPDGDSIYFAQRRDVGLADIILDKCVRSHGKRRRGGKMPRAI